MYKTDSFMYNLPNIYTIIIPMNSNKIIIILKRAIILLLFLLIFSSFVVFILLKKGIYINRLNVNDLELYQIYLKLDDKLVFKIKNVKTTNMKKISKNQSRELDDLKYFKYIKMLFQNIDIGVDKKYFIIYNSNVFYVNLQDVHALLVVDNISDHKTIIHITDAEVKSLGIKIIANINVQKNKIKYEGNLFLDNSKIKLGFNGTGNPKTGKLDIKFDKDRFKNFKFIGRLLKKMQVSQNIIDWIVTKHNAKNIVLQELSVDIDLNSANLKQNIDKNLKLILTAKNFNYSYDKNLSPVKAKDFKYVLEKNTLNIYVKNSFYNDIHIKNLNLKFPNYSDIANSGSIEVTLDTKSNLNNKSVQQILHYFNINPMIEEIGNTPVNLHFSLKHKFNVDGSDIKFKLYQDKDKIITIKEADNNYFSFINSEMNYDNGIISGHGTYVPADSIKIPFSMSVGKDNIKKVTLNTKNIEFDNKNISNTDSVINIEKNKNNIKIVSKKAINLTIGKATKMKVLPINTTIHNKIDNFVLGVIVENKYIKKLKLFISIKDYKNGKGNVSLGFENKKQVDYTASFEMRKISNGFFLSFLNTTNYILKANMFNTNNIAKLILFNSHELQIMGDQNSFILRAINYKLDSDLSPFLNNSKKNIANYDIILQIRPNDLYDVYVNNSIHYAYKNDISSIDINGYTIDLYKLQKLEKSLAPELFSNSSKGVLHIIGTNSNIIYSDGKLENKIVYADKYIFKKENGEIHIDIKTGKKGDIHIKKGENDHYVIKGSHATAKFVSGLFGLKNISEGDFNFEFIGNSKSFSTVINISDGVISDFQVLNTLNNFFDAIPSIVLFKVDSSMPKNGYYIKNSTIWVHKDGNIFYFDSIKSNSNSSGIIAKGTYDVKKDNLDITANVFFVKNLSSLLKKVYLNYIFFGKDRRAIIHLKITGSLNNPKVENHVVKSTILYPISILKRVITLPILPFLKDYNKEDNQTTLPIYNH